MRIATKVEVAMLLNGHAGSTGLSAEKIDECEKELAFAEQEIDILLANESKPKRLEVLKDYAYLMNVLDGAVEPGLSTNNSLILEEYRDGEALVMSLKDCSLTIGTVSKDKKNIENEFEAITNNVGQGKFVSYKGKVTDVTNLQNLTVKIQNAMVDIPDHMMILYKNLNSGQIMIDGDTYAFPDTDAGRDMMLFAAVNNPTSVKGHLTLSTVYNDDGFDMEYVRKAKKKIMDYSSVSGVKAKFSLKLSSTDDGVNIGVVHKIKSAKRESKYEFIIL